MWCTGIHAGRTPIQEVIFKDLVLENRWYNLLILFICLTIYLWLVCYLLCRSVLPGILCLVNAGWKVCPSESQSMGARDNLEVRRVCGSSIRPEWFSAPTFGNSHISETPASRDLVPPSGLCGNCTSLHIPSHRNKHTLTVKNKNK